MTKTRKRLILVGIALAALCLLVFFFSSILIPFLRHQINGDYEGAREVLESRGVLGLIAVPLIEAMQMVVVFIPAEFIQISAGLAFSWRIAVPLCVLGVFAGASLIYLLVHFWNFEVDRGQERIERLRKRESKVGIYPFLTLLFFMPVVPFGAICYFGASRKSIRYLPYVLTCTLSALPSIVTSNVLGLGVRLFLAQRIPFWALLLIILGGALLLFLLIFFVLSRLYFKPAAGTPDSPWYDVIHKLAGLLIRLRMKPEFDTAGWELPDGAALYVSNHPSQLDYVLTAKLTAPVRIVSVANEYYFRKGIAKKAMTAIGTIPKKLFVEEPSVILKARRTVKAGYSIYLAPEGRMSLTGVPYPIISSTGAFARFLGVPLVTLRLEGAFLNKPKWRPSAIRRKVRIRVQRVVSSEELKAMTPEEVNDLIREDIRFDDYAFAREEGLVYRSGKKAAGLSRVLYRCPVCGKLYSMKEEGNALSCVSCGLRLGFDTQYALEENAGGFVSLPEAYRALEEREKAEKATFSCKVSVRRFEGEKEEAGSGVCTLGPDGFVFTGEAGGADASFSVPAGEMKPLPFSCGEEFETYHEGRLYYFYPEEHREQCARFALVSDLMSEGKL